MTTVTKLEQTQVEKANASGKRPVVFVHGLWLLPTSWDRWAKVFEGEGFAALSPGWPDDPDTVAEAREHPEVMAGRGLSKVSVAISPAPFRGVLPLPISALRSGSPVLRNPGNRNRTVPLTFEQFRYSFANAVSQEEAKRLYDTYCVRLRVSRSSRPPPPT